MMKIAAIRNWFAISLAVISLAWLAYSVGYTNGASAHPQVQAKPQIEQLVTPFQFNGADYTVDQFGTIRDVGGQPVQGSSSNLALELAAATATAGDIPIATTPAMIQPVNETADGICNAQSC